MKLFIACLAALALIFASSATACPPVDPDGGGSFSFGAGYGAEACAAPMIAGNFGGYNSYGGGAMVAAPSYGVQSFAAPAYAAPLVQRQVFAAPAYGYGAGLGVNRGFGSSYGGFAAPVRVRSFRSFAAPAYGYGSVGLAAPVVHTRAFVAPAYGVTVAAPVVAVPVRAPGPIRGAVQGFFGGVRNRLNGF